MKCISPVLLIIFNRPLLTKKVFSVIKEARPSKLYIAADGPRPIESEEELCSEAREIISTIDWDCNVNTKFRKENIGCGLGPKSAIDWFFQNENQGIILEDDCLPSIDFFKFCDEMLLKYENDCRIMHINGSNFHKGWSNNSYSYYFSQYGYCWGWATWKRAWKYFDFYVHHYNEIEYSGLYKDFFYKNTSYKEYFKQLPANNRNDIWDYQWEFCRFIQSGLAITPNVNLVKNIGIGSGTHTMYLSKKYQNTLERKIEFPLLHPPYVLRDSIADRRYYIKFLKRGWWQFVIKIVNSFYNRRRYKKLREFIKIISKRYYLIRLSSKVTQE